MLRGEFADPEVWEDCDGQEMSRWVHLFLPMSHTKYGHFVQYPSTGGLLEQPATTMHLLEIVQEEYYGYLEEVNRCRA
jgi:hypothetical protein